MTVELRTLGRLAVTVDGTEVPDITAQPVRAALLVYLAVERAATRDAVLACIWPEAGAAAARHALSQTLYQLRQDLGDDWLDTAGSYLRATPALDADVSRFVDAVDARRYDEALTDYRGAFLDGCHLVAAATFETWTDRHRGRLARLHRRARREQIERFRAAGRLDAALGIARRWAEIEPLEDEAQQHLILLLWDAGERSESLRHYADFARLLAQEELEPLPETAALVEELRRSGGPARPPLTGAAPEPPAAPRAAAPSPARRRWPIAALAALTLVVASTATVLLRRPRAAHAIGSVAVLPFENLTDDPAEEYFVDGIHEALIADLSQVGDLRVISRTSALQFRGTARSIPEIAAALHVDAVIEGSVLRAGDSVRIQASLIDAATDRSMGTVAHVAALQNVLGLIHDVARRIADELTVAGARARDGADTASRPVEPAAYEAYLHARHLLLGLPGDDWERATQLYLQAIAIDSTFGLAQMGLAETEFLLGFFRMRPYEAAWAQARERALRALRLDPNLAEAYTVLGYVALYGDWDWQAAEQALVRALRLNPNEPMARHGYGDLLMLRGRVEESLEQVELARAADPLSPLVHATVIGHLYFARHFDDVLTETRRIEAETGQPGLGRYFEAAALWQLGQYGEALAAFRDAWSGDPAAADALSRGEEEGGPFGAIHALADYAARQAAAGTGATSYDVATLYARAGDADAAFTWLDRACGEHLPTFLHMIGDPVFDALRADPRYATLLRRLGLPPE